MYQILTLNKISPIGLEKFDRSKYTWADDTAAPDAVMVRSASMHDMELPPSVLAIARAGAGVNNIPLDACAQKGIVVFNTPGANANAVKEMVILGLLMASRKVATGMAWVQGLKGSGDLSKQVEKGKSQFVGPELRGKTLGVIGLGAIGAIVANAAARGLGMKVIGFDPFISVDSAWSLSSQVQRAANQDEVLAQADYLTVHIPLNDQTRGFIQEEFLAKMKPGARLLNFSRGELVDASALKQALADGRLACYVTDFPNEDVLGTEGVICIPHLGASTPESEENCARMAAAQLRDYLEWGSIHNSVNLPELPLSAPTAARILVIHENIPNMLSTISACVSREGINIDTMVNKSRKALAVTVMEMADLPSEAAVNAIAALDGVIRVRTFMG